MLAFRAVDSHTEGMPTRVITDGVGELPGETMLERKLRFESERDGIRRLLMREPRGHGAMSGAILQRPTRPEADWGVVFIEVSGCLPMCGHGAIGVATVLVEDGLVPVSEPETVVMLDVPAGLVQARVRVVDGHARAVTLQSVPAFVDELGAEVDGIGYDMAFGGNFCATADAASAGLSVAPERAGELIAAGLELMAAVPEPVHPVDPEIRGCRHVIWTAVPSAGAGADGRAATAIHPGWVDRSPCGTGTSARMAALHARGQLAIGETFVHESIIGTRFTGRLVGETAVGGRPAVVPEITGRAWVTGRSDYVLDPTDPFRGASWLADVIVVGAGICGAAVAHFLAAAHARVRAASRPRGRFIHHVWTYLPTGVHGCATARTRARRRGARRPRPGRPAGRPARDGPGAAGQHRGADRRRLRRDRGRLRRGDARRRHQAPRA